MASMTNNIKFVSWHPEANSDEIFLTYCNTMEFFEKSIGYKSKRVENIAYDFDRIVQCITMEIESAIKDDSKQLPSIDRNDTIPNCLSENSEKKVNTAILDKLKESGWRFDNNPSYPRITLTPLSQITTR